MRVHVARATTTLQNNKPTPNLSAYFVRKDDFVSEVRFWSAVLFTLDWRYVLCVNTLTASIYIAKVVSKR